ETICAWRDEIIRPLRQLRTRLKSGPPPAPDKKTNGLRNRVKRLELDAERIQQDVLAQWVAAQTVPLAAQQISEAEQAGTVESAACMVRLEQTAVRVVAFYEA